MTDTLSRTFEDPTWKIDQGLGAHLEKVGDVVEVKGDKARLLLVAERAKALYGKDAGRDTRFVVEEGVGKDPRFWKLAQSLSAPYPAGSEEKLGRRRARAQEGARILGGGTHELA